MITKANPPSKKRKIEKTRAEKGMERAIETFIKYQNQAEERFRKYEEKRWKKETELEDNRRRQDQEHEMRMMAILGQMFRGGNHHNYAGAYDFDFEETDMGYQSDYYQQ